MDRIQKTAASSISLRVNNIGPKSTPFFEEFPSSRRRRQIRILSFKAIPDVKVRHSQGKLQEKNRRLLLEKSRIAARAINRDALMKTAPPGKPLPWGSGPLQRRVADVAGGRKPGRPERIRMDRWAARLFNVGGFSPDRGWKAPAIR